MDYTLQIANVCYNIGMGLPAEKRKYTTQEYLEMEEKAVERHEFHDGEILMMSGGTLRHSRIVMNTGATLHALLKGKPCFALDSNMRVRISDRWHYVYPDISVVCGTPIFDPDDPKKTTIINPRVVIEVLSESTESYDRGGKFDGLRVSAGSEGARRGGTHAIQVQGDFRPACRREVEPGTQFIQYGLFHTGNGRFGRAK